jgi:hypothetical protein
MSDQNTKPKGTANVSPFYRTGITPESIEIIERDLMSKDNVWWERNIGVQFLDNDSKKAYVNQMIHRENKEVWANETYYSPAEAAAEMLLTLRKGASLGQRAIIDEALACVRACNAYPHAERLAAVCKRMRESIRHAHTCKAPMAFPCSCDADTLWRESETILAQWEAAQQ